MAKQLVVFVDVDDTLVRHVGTKQIPMPAVIDHVRALHASGVVLYCWSTGGADYAHRMATELSIEDCFQGFLPKPNVMIDDQAVADWRQCIEVTPAETAGRGPADYENLLRTGD